MKPSRFNINSSLCGINIDINTNDIQRFNTLKGCFHRVGGTRRSGTNKKIHFYLEKRKILPRGRWDLHNWKSGTYSLESWSRDITVRLDYHRGIIRSYLSSQCKFASDTIEDLLIFRPLSLMMSKYGFFAIHAGCVAKDGNGILIPGNYGSGKTITTLNLVRKGYKFLGDECVLLKKTGGRIRTYAFPQKVGLKKDMLNLLPELKFLADRKSSAHNKKRFWIDEAYKKTAIAACYPQIVIFPHFKKNGPLKAGKMSGKEALFNILADKDNRDIINGLASKDRMSKYFSILSSLIEQTDIHRLDYSEKGNSALSKIVGKRRR